MTLNSKQQQFVDYAIEKFGKSTLSMTELKEANAHFGCKYAPQWLIKNPDYKIGKGMFKLPSDDSGIVENQPQTISKPTPQVDNSDIKTEAAYVVSSLTGDIVPKKDKQVC